MSKDKGEWVAQPQESANDGMLQKLPDTAPSLISADSVSGGQGSGLRFHESVTGGNPDGSSSAAMGRQIAIVRQKSRKTKEVSEPKPVYAEDIDFGPKGSKSSAQEVLVKNARTRVRVNRIKNGQPKGRHLDSDKKKDEKRVNLTIRMMLGVRVAVGLQSNPLTDYELTEEDFERVDKYTFPPAGTTGRLPTPSHKLNKTFKFRDYAPKVFKKLRELYGIDESAYLMSVAGNYEYLELITNSKSGSFFFFSHDQRYIIKAMKSSEAKFFRGILGKYYEHHVKHPDSLLIRFCGMYMVKNGRRKIPFIVMVCVDGNANKKIHLKYDLKGSSVNRTAKEGEKVLKDNDLDGTHGNFHLGSQRERFLQVARADAEFLRSVNVMDYSMLASIHDKSKPQELFDRRQLLQRGLSYHSAFFTFADEAQGKSAPAYEPLPSAGDEAEEKLEAESSGEAKETEEEEMNGESVVSSDGDVLKYRKDGGIDSGVESGSASGEIYYMGIIDILQQYTRLKHAETYYKSLALNNKREELSCVDPDLYCKRFIGFLEGHTD